MRALVIALLALTSFSCASIIDGRTHDTIPISSEPQGATVHLNGIPVGETPMQLRLPRSAEPEAVHLALEGFHNQPVRFSSHVNGWVFGNLVFGGIIGLLIDIGTDNSTYWSDKPVHAVLVPSDKPASSVVPAGAKAKKKRKRTGNLNKGWRL